MSKRLETALAVVRESFDAGDAEGERAAFIRLVRGCDADWRRLARYIHGRWQIPPGLDVEDVRQVMYVAARKAIENWDADNAQAYPLDKYVVWSAIDAARKYIHVERQALKRDGRAPSRHPINFSALSTEERQDPGWTPANQEDRADLSMRIRSACKTQAELVIAAALVGSGGDPSFAAARLVSEPKLRLVTGLERRAVAIRACKRVARLIAEVK